MSTEDRWLLPEGIEEVLPPQAARLEGLRREIIDLYSTWGYELVIPPFIEYLESLFTGTGRELDLQTFKLTDQLTGRLMGVRADMTPQVARIDAHQLKRNDLPTRLCYLGTVLHTRPDGSGGSRSPYQVGAELYGHAGVESDAEVLCLMLETLKLAGITEIHVDLGHMGIFRGLADQAKLSSVQKSSLFESLQRKATPEVQALLSEWSVAADVRDMLVSLVDLNGDISVLDDAERVLKKAGKLARQCLTDLRHIAELVAQRITYAPLNFDLAELRGYHYHTGVIFAAYVPGRGQAIALGGRYDDIGQAFGRARPATGFSTADLKALIALNPSPATTPSGTFAPCLDDPALADAVLQLRQQGERVVCALPGQTGGASEMACDRQLERQDGRWVVVKL